MEFELEKLRELKAPEPSEKGRETAVLAAMTAFDQATDEKVSTQTQGSAVGTRPTSIVEKLWSKFMNSAVKPIWTMKPATMAAAATVMLMPIGGLVAWDVYRDTQRQGSGALETKSERDVLPGKKAHLAKEPAVASSQDREAVPPARELSSPNEDQGQVLAELQQKAARTRAKLKFRQDVPKARANGPTMMFPQATGQSQGIVAPQPLPVPEASRELYTEFSDNGVKSVAEHPVSTFSVDVDTASYSRVRRALMSGNLPAKDMVRIEELVNYFDYDYTLPADRAQPFRPELNLMPSPWKAHTQLLHIGIKGFDIAPAERPAANLVFLLDISGSMNQPDKLPLLIKSFRLLLQKLNPDDTVSIVTYAGRAGTVLEPTKASNKSAILDALNNLRAGGSTAGAQGIERAYALAKKSFVKDGVNRVMLATDGDFNVGISDPKQLKDFIARKRREGIFLSVFGFGRGNYNDALMQSLAQNGNGTAAYIDTLAEAQKTLVEEAGSTLFPIAKDVKIQMEFNPAQIAEYRLIGYETRALKREDFNNDRVDAGDIGAGHSVTAIYELTPVGSPAVLNTKLRYGETKTPASNGLQNETGYLKIRYKLPNESKSKLIETPLPGLKRGGGFAAENVDTRFSVAVAAFGQKLRGNAAVDEMTYEDVAKMAADARGEDKFGYRSAFVQLVRMAGSLSK